MKSTLEKIQVKNKKVPDKKEPTIKKRNKRVAKKVEQNGQDPENKETEKKKRTRKDPFYGPYLGDTIQTVKCFLKTIVKDDEAGFLKKNDILNRINEIVSTCNKVTIHALQLIKAYFLYLDKNDKPFPKVNRAFIYEALLIFRYENFNNPDLYSLEYFFTEYYRPTMNEEFNMLNLDQILNYTSVSLVTDFNNNVKQRYDSYIKKLIDVSLEKSRVIGDIKKSGDTKERISERLKEFKYELVRVKNAIKEVENDKRQALLAKIRPEYVQWINRFRGYIVPFKKKYNENGLIYDLKESIDISPYFKCMFNMMKECEFLGCKKLNNLFPLRSDIAPKYFRFDTISVAFLLFPRSNKGTKYQTKNYYSNHVDENKEEIWDRFFKTNKKIFRKSEENHYQFHFMIETDGVGCSILLSKRCIKDYSKSIELYTNSESINYEKYQNKNIVGIDPNKSDLIFCMDSYGNKFRYTQCQRKKEIGFKRNREKLKNAKLETKILYAGELQNINQIESKLSFHSKKSMDLDSFFEYIKLKNKINKVLEEFYYRKVWRTIKFETVSRTKKSEQIMVNNFAEVFGDPNETVIGFGNYGSAHMRGIEPVKGKGFRKTLRHAGYEVFLVDEFRTSKMCSDCGKAGGECKTFSKRKEKKSKRESETKVETKKIERLVHGLLRCQACLKIWNRDVNASTNICKIALLELKGGIRPDYLRRNNPHQ